VSNFVGNFVKNASFPEKAGGALKKIKGENSSYQHMLASLGHKQNTANCIRTYRPL